jgi:hypothetical protein
MLNNTEILFAFLQKNSIYFEELTPQEVECFKLEWFDKFVPVDKREEARKCYCFDNDGCCGYLWHVFSYEILNCHTKYVANEQFDNTEKHEAILLLNIDETAYRIKDTSKLTAKDFEILYDAILTDCDFNWTYVKTHEELQCGPYFFSTRAV